MIDHRMDCSHDEQTQAAAFDILHAAGMLWKAFIMHMRAEPKAKPEQDPTLAALEAEIAAVEAGGAMVRPCTRYI